MAITKIHPIKTTLNISIDYICDPSKTDDEILISTSENCGHKTASMEFEMTRKNWNSTTKNLARHLIQSFMPDEVTPDVAHEIGIKLIEEHLKGKYEYVITTHVDKSHIHNHIIFNNVSFIDGRAYNSNKRSYHQIRNISDRLCREYNLSVVDEISKYKLVKKINGQSYKEYTERKKGNSWKAKLQYSIDLAIKKSRNWEEFLEEINKLGYEMKSGKYISFKAKKQERYTRSKTIGADYTEVRIKERLNNKVVYKLNLKGKNKFNSNKVIDISLNELAKKSEGFARWLKLQNLKIIAKTWNTFTLDDVNSISEFNEQVDNAYDKLSEIQNKIKIVESKILLNSTNIKNINIYKKYRKSYIAYSKLKNKDKYFRNHESEIILFEASKEALGKPVTKKLLLSVPKLKEENIKLSNSKKLLNKELVKQKKEVKDIYDLKVNLETYLGKDVSKYIPKSR